MTYLISDFLHSSSAIERTSFKKFLHSPFFGSSKNYAEVFQDLERLLRRRNFTEENVDEIIHKHVSADSSLRNLKSRLKERLKLFHAIEKCKKDEFDILCKLQTKFTEIDRYDLYCEAITEAFKLLQKKEILEAEDFLRHSDLASDYYFHNDTNKRDSKTVQINTFRDSKKKAHSLLYANEQLDKFYYLKKLFIILEHKSRLYIGVESEDLPEANQIIELAKQLYKNEQGIFQPIFMLIDCYDQGFNHIRVSAVLSELKKQQQYISSSYTRTIHSSLMILAVRCAPEFRLKVLATLMNYAEENNIILLYGRIPNIFFINYVNTFSLLKEFDKVDRFILKYRNLLSEKDRETIILTAELFRLFQAGEWKKTLQKGIDYRPKTPAQEEVFYPLLLRCAYEEVTDDCKTVIKLYERFRQHLKRKGYYNEKKKREYRNFNNKLLVLAKAKVPFGTDENHLDSLEKEIKEESDIFAKNWLLDKIVELKEKIRCV